LFSFLLSPQFAHFLEFGRDALIAVLLHRNVSVEMVERSVCL
jgi:hypothetical protein